MRQNSHHLAAAPLSESSGPSFLVGQNGRGQWLAVESHGSGGGLFASRDAAMRYASKECGRRPQAVRLADGVIELRF